MTTYTVETVPSDRVPATGTLPALRTIVLRRIATPAPRPNRDALPFLPAPAPASPVRRSWTRRNPPPEDGWCAPDGAAIKALRSRAGLTQRGASALGFLERGIVSDIETGRRSVGKGITAETLRPYVEALEKAAAGAE